MKLVQKLFFISIFSLGLLAISSTVTQAADILTLQTSSSQIEKDQEATVTISLNTQGQSVIGVDIILNFDAAKLNVKEIQATGLFPNYPVHTYDNTTGVIQLAASSNYDDYFRGQGTLATITVQGKSEGSSAISFSWSPGATNDTNVVSAQAEDLLTQAPGSLSLEVTSPSGTPESPTSTPTPAPGSSESPTPTIHPEPSESEGERPTPTQKPSLIEEIVEKIFPKEEKAPSLSPIPTPAEKPVQKSLLPLIVIILLGVASIGGLGFYLIKACLKD